MKKAPGFLKKYFWDVDFGKLDVKAYPLDTIGRILENGDLKGINWLTKNFSRKEIVEVLLRLRIVSPKSANFWSLIFGVDKKKILCLQKPYLKNTHWPY
ncbi:MAG: hypothetical protein ABII74_08800 [Elusimicrobiota bacterium]